MSIPEFRQEGRVEGNFNMWKMVRGSTTSKDKIGGPVLGIDLGTSNSCIAIWNPEKNRSKIIKNIMKGRTTPSTVSYGNSFKEVIIGTQDNKTTLSGFKTVLGLNRSDIETLYPPGVASPLPNIEYDKDDDICLRGYCSNSSGITSSKNESKLLSPEELSSEVLKYLKMCAEDYLHRKPVPNLPNGSTMDDSNGVITRAVIGVPANFSEARKRVLRHAATLAGFDDVHLMVESTAAAMAYGLLVAGSKMILIFDMGGGTLDLSAMAVSDGCFEVLAMGGHGTCGGRAMDTLLMRHVVGRAVAASNTSGKNINTLSSVEVIIESLNSTQKDTLLLLCRTCKEMLTDKLDATIHIPIDIWNILLSKDKNTTSSSSSSTTTTAPTTTTATATATHPLNVSRAEFEKVIAPLLEIVEKVVINVVHQWRESKQQRQQQQQQNHNNNNNNDNNNNNEQHSDNIGGETVWVLDEVVLVGGASRIPAVRETLRKAMGAAGEEKFSPTGKGVLCTSISPDEAVAQGLAIRGGVLMGVDTGLLKDILMIDALPSTIGIRSFTTPDDNTTTSDTTICEDKDTNHSNQFNDDDMLHVNGYFEPVLIKGSKLPASATKTFTLADEKQRFVSLDVYEEVGDGDDSHVTVIGTFDVPIALPVGFDKNSTGEDQKSVDVTFNMSEDGVLTFSVNRPGCKDSDKTGGGGVGSSSSSTCVDIGVEDNNDNSALTPEELFSNT
eukprot:gene8626-17793_t